MKHILPTVTVMAIIALGLAVSFQFATAGEPQSVWLWGDVLGLP